MHVHNHSAFPKCTTRQQKIECVGEAMRRIGEGCTLDDLKVSLGATEADLKPIVDDARAYAMTVSEHQIRASVPARRAA